MTLPVLVTVDDFAAWVGEDISAGDLRAQAFLVGASARVRSYTGRTWVGDTGELEDVPDDVATVVKQVAERKWRNPAGYIQDTTGPFTVRYSERTGDGIFLTEGEKETLDAYRGERAALWTLRTEKCDPYLWNVARDTVYAPVEGGEPMPWYDRRDVGDDL